MKDIAGYEGIYIFDIECFPNFFSVTFQPLDGESCHFEIGPRTDQRTQLERWILRNKNLELVGFNSIDYDTPMLRYLLDHIRDKQLLTNLYQFSGRLIHSNFDDEEVSSYRYRNVPWKQIDLMKMEALHRTGVGLKQAGINLKWPWIQDLPVEHDHFVTKEEVPKILEYNNNDVQITLALYHKLIDEVNLRKEVSALYKIDASSASRSKMANLILEKIYVQETGRDIRSLKELRTKRQTVSLGDCIAPAIHFKDPELQRLLATFQATTVSAENRFAFRQGINFRGKHYDLGVGGLHSDDEPGCFLHDPGKVLLRDADVASYYPSIMIQNKIRPDHLGPEFTKIMRQITADRIEAKRSGQKTKADALKITINSIFGKLGAPTYWLEDAKAFLSVTVSGQLYLMMLIERLTDVGIEILSANTDGVLSKIPVGLEDTYRGVCQEWMAVTGFSLEFTDYSAYIRTDVNNYLAVKLDGKTKEKGRFVRDIDIHGGYKPPIVAKALYNYFVEGKPVEETLYSSEDYYDFCLSQKTGAQFTVDYRFPTGQWETLQKNNRFFCSLKGGSLVKRHKLTSKKTSILAGMGVEIANDLREAVFDGSKINYNYYLREIMKIIDEIQPQFVQMSLFA